MSQSVSARHDNASIIAVRDAHFAFNTRSIYRGVDVDIPRGKVTAIMGPSGCGKSTLLALIGGRLRPSHGELLFDGVSVPDLRGPDLYQLRKRMGMLFQHSALLTDMNVFDNVAFPVREHTELPEVLVRNLVLVKLQMVGLRGARNLMPDELSGGMARRVALARAIALDPDVVMYDEPFAGLDPISMGMVVKLIRELNDALGLTSIVVTHDVKEGFSIADQVYLLGGGKVIGRGSPDEMMHSDLPEIKQFVSGLPDGPVPFHYSDDDYIDDLFSSHP